MSKKAKTLFVKEGDDLVYQKGSPTDGSGFRTSVYRHFESNLRVILCRVPRPLCSLNIYVPTVSSNNKGLPHTLEHLIFCGSREFPNRGYLDALAICNFSGGTNAWTTADHTCYTLSAAGEEAVANVLPVFLDHVLHPLLRDDQFVTEVYHFDETGKEQGVVFSEMLSRENDEGDLLEHHLNRLLFAPRSAYAFECGGLTKDIATLSNQEIVEYHRKFYDANNVTILITGPLSEKFEDTLQDLPVDMLQSNGLDSRSPIDCSEPTPDAPRSMSVPFPSAEADIGSFGFGWRGPPSEDVEALTAIEVLMDYLAETASSPLNQRFVERPAPLASYVYVDVRASIPSCVVMYFGGVPYTDPNAPAAEAHDDDGSDSEDGSDCESDDGAAADDKDIPLLFTEGYFESLLVEELQRIHSSKFDGDPSALKMAARRFRQKLAANMEKNPEDVIQEMICADVVSAHFSPFRNKGDGAPVIGSRAKVFDIIDALAEKPLEYWLELLKRFIDGPIVHVAMVPDADLGKKLEDERKEIEGSNRGTIADEKAHAKAIEQAVEANKVDLPRSLKKNMPSPDPASIISLPHSLSLVAPQKPIGPASAIQLVEFDSEFPEIKLHIPTSALPDELRPYLVLFQELLLSTDMVLPAGLVYDTETSPGTEDRRIGYVTVDNRLADITTSHEAAVGYGNDRFACSWLDELFNVYVRVPDDKFRLAVRWLVQVIMFADFTAERIVTVAQNLLSEIVDLKRLGDSMISAVTTLFTTEDRAGKPRWIDNHISVFEQETVLKSIVKDVKAGQSGQIVAQLAGIQRALVNGSGGFLSLGVPSGKNSQAYADEFAHEWGVCYDKFSRKADSCEASGADVAAAAAAVPNGDSGSCCNSRSRPLLFKLADPFPLPRTIRFPDLSKPLRVHIPMPSLQSSYAQICFKCDLSRLPTGERSLEDELADLPALDFYALSMLTSLLQRTDGPLYNAIRGKGYAYGSYFQQYMWTGLLVFGCSSASDAPKAILEMQRLIGDLETQWDDYVTDFEIRMTRSTMVYESTIAQATPHNIMASCVTSNICGFESVEQHNRWRNVHLSAVRQTDLRRVYELYLKRFLDQEYPAFTVILTPPGTELPAELGEFERKALDDLSSGTPRV
ncbi:hypothetical protein GQ54DRAFT_295466 [Martensiomyces pterosporus]|nr:hypothetical protein GQ54DRAFT_295466 [Martensiomyces pterosporus]